MMEFKTTDVNVFAVMIAKAIECGLTFDAVEAEGTFFIKYYGGF